MTDRVTASFVPLVDCAVLVAARERGFAAAAGIELELVKEPSWASLRDHLCLGHVDCAHALAPLPVALTLGVGHVQVDCIAPFVLGRGGNAITVSKRLFGRMERNAPDGLADALAAGRALAAAVRERLTPPTLGMVFPFSNHNFDMRYWLASAGIHPDHDVRLVAIPPPLMVDSLRAGLVDGFCVGEPWNSLAEAQDLGSIVATQSQLFPRTAEKVLAVRASFAERSAVLARLLQALDAAAAWVDDAAHHGELAALLSLPKYLNVPPGVIVAGLAGRLRMAAAAERGETDFMYFHRHGANVPHPTDGLWSYAQMVRWGQLAPSKHAERIAAAVFRPDLYSSSIAMAESAEPALQSFDRVEFSATNVSAYLRQFDVRTPFAQARSV